MSYSVPEIAGDDVLECISSTKSRGPPHTQRACRAVYMCLGTCARTCPARGTRHAALCTDCSSLLPVRRCMQAMQAGLSYSTCFQFNESAYVAERCATTLDVSTLANVV